MDKEVVIHSDGGSRGNPGPAAGAYVIRSPDGRMLMEDGIYLGVATNNVAEYRALLAALEKVVKLGAQKVTCFLDSELVVKQLNGQYRIREEKMRQLFSEVAKIIGNFKSISFRHVPRNENKRADEIVNRTLDAHL